MLPFVHRAAAAAALLQALALVAPLLAVPSVAAQERFRFDATPGRLSKHVVPLHQAIALDLDPARDGFDGRVEITVRVRRPVDAIEVHAHTLEVREASLAPPAERRGPARALDVVPDAGAQTWRLAPVDGRPVAVGTHRIRIAYRGPVNKQGTGLFRADAVVDGRTEPTLATQLEAIHARRVFPAFDEPAFRTRFALTVRAPAGYEVLSNMPRRSRRVDGATATHRFATTPSMPSYLVAVAVGRYDVLEGRAAGVPLRIVTAPGKRDQGRFALEATRALLPFYTRYFGVPYALPRLDQLAVPSVRWGAMEDWGLISYNEGALLVDPARTGPARQQGIYGLIAHEVAHQWFGNLVTAASWSEIWLNEAFATWMAAKATHHFHPDWQVALNGRRFIDETMAGDATDATRAIRSGPVRETAVLDVFDDITYAKGGAVLAMIEQWIGDAAFRRGLAAYMRERRLSNATAGDLWHHIGRAAGRDVGAMAASWTDQPGFPLVTLAARCEGGRTVVELVQQRYRARGEGAPAASAAAPLRWQIPVRLSRGAQSATLLLVGAEARTTLAGCSDEPVRANAGGAGFYRTAYADDARAALRERLAALPAADRVVLLADTVALAQDGWLPLGEVSRLLAMLAQVPDAGREPLFKQAVEVFAELDHAFAGLPQQAALRESARALLGAELARLGWDPKPADAAATLALRARLVRQLAALDDPATLAEALARAARDEAGAAPLHASMREAVTIASGVGADRKRFDALLARLAASASEEDRRMLVTALASGRDAARTGELLDRMLAPGVPSNLAAMAPGLVAEHSPHGALAYRHVVERWAQWEKIAGETGKRWLLPSVAEQSADAALARALVEDQARLVGPDGDALAARAAARIGQRDALRARAATMAE